MKITCSKDVKAKIYGSFILFMIDNLLDDNDKKKGVVIKFRQQLAKVVIPKNQFVIVRDSKNVDQKRIDIANLSNKIWSKTIAAYKDSEKAEIVLGDFIEMLVLDEQKDFETVFGSEIIDLSFKVSLKISPENVDPKRIKMSREITKTLIDFTRKESYEYCKGKKK